MYQWCNAGPAWWCNACVYMLNLFITFDSIHCPDPVEEVNGKAAKIPLMRKTTTMLKTTLDCPQDKDSTVSLEQFTTLCQISHLNSC